MAAFTVQFPIDRFGLAVVSVTVELTTVLRSVPVGNRIVIWSLLARDNAPVADVVNETVYTVRAPAAAEGGVSTTVTLPTDEA